MATNRRALSGPRAKVLIENNEVGWATDISVSEDLNQQPVEALGDVNAKQIEPTGRRITGTIGFIRIINESLRQQGVWPEQPTSNVVEFGPLVIEVLDDITDETTFKLEGVKPTTRNWNIGARSLTNSDMSFMAINIIDVT